MQAAAAPRLWARREWRGAAEQTCLSKAHLGCPSAPSCEQEAHSRNMATKDSRAKPRQTS